MLPRGFLMNLKPLRLPYLTKSTLHGLVVQGSATYHNFHYISDDKIYIWILLERNTANLCDTCHVPITGVKRPSNISK